MKRRDGGRKGNREGEKRKEGGRGERREGGGKEGGGETNTSQVL